MQPATPSLYRQIVLALHLMDGFGYTTFAQLCQQVDRFYPDLAEAYQDRFSQIRIDQKSKLRSHLKQLLKIDLANLKKQVMSWCDFVVTIGDELYPKLLREIDRPPLVLFGQGRAEALQQRAVSLVGTRRMTQYGQLAASKLAKELVAHDWVTVSGGMYGVDQAIHQATVQHQGVTIMVLGCGLNYQSRYPNRQLCQQVIEHGGCIVSEYPDAVAPQKGMFVQRNRIVAGLSLATVVVEAGQRSGSHITALNALESGRQVYAVPGSILSPFSEGTAALINQGAKLVTSGTQITQELYPQFADILAGATSVPADPVIQLLQTQPSTLQQLELQLNQSAQQISAQLYQLLSIGLVKRQGQMWYACTL